MAGKARSQEEFIGIANKKHHNKYDYSKTEYINNRTKICIICPKHGEFFQTPHSHLKGHGCSLCKAEKTKQRMTLTTEEFICRAIKIHGNKFDYTKVEYKNNEVKVCIICPKHDEFWQKPHEHLRGTGCQKCYDERRGENKVYSVEEWIDKVRKAHNGKYDYSKVEYYRSSQKVCIICPEHGEFWQIPAMHLSGRGCPICKQSHLENKVEQMLKENNIKYISQYKTEWLGKQSLDFYLPDYNIGIECQGRQHFENDTFFGGIEGFKKINKRDKQKLKLCKEQKISLLYYTEEEYKEFLNESVYNKLEDLLKNIKTANI